MGFGHTHLFFSSRLISWEDDEAVLFVAIMGNVLLSMLKSDVENDMEVEFLRTSNGGSSLHDDEKLVDDS
jgi:hypothetical protein